MRDIENYQKEYDKLPFEAYQVEYRRKKVKELLLQNNHKTVLEIGCGMKPLFLDIKDVDRWVIVEPNRVFYENAVNSSDENTVCINEFFEDAVKDIKKLNIEFDYVVVSCLLHEVPEPQRLLRAIYEICSVNTVVHINVPNALSVHRLLAVEAGFIENVYETSQTQKLMQQREQVYDLNSLKKECELAGFDVIESASFFIKPFTHSQMQACIDKEVFNTRVLDGFYNLVKYMPEYGSEIYVQAKIKGVC